MANKTGWQPQIGDKLNLGEFLKRVEDESVMHDSVPKVKNKRQVSFNNRLP